MLSAGAARTRPERVKEYCVVFVLLWFRFGDAGPKPIWDKPVRCGQSYSRCDLSLSCIHRQCPGVCARRKSNSKAQDSSWAFGFSDLSKQLYLIPQWGLNDSGK